MQVERVHRGAVFDVYKLIDPEGTWAFKVRAEQPRTEEAAGTRFVRSAILGGGSTLWNLWGGIGASAPSSHPETEQAQLRKFLEAEAARIRSSRGTWNHEVRCLAGPPRPPRAIDPAVSPAEERLAMALLELAIDSREQLVELVAEVLRQAAGTQSDAHAGMRR